jgi:hypothetical protein
LATREELNASVTIILTQVKRVFEDGLVCTLAEVQGCGTADAIYQKWEGLAKVMAMAKIIETKCKSAKYCAFGK